MKQGRWIAAWIAFVLLEGGSTAAPQAAKPAASPGFDPVCVYEALWAMEELEMLSTESPFTLHAGLPFCLIPNPLRWVAACMASDPVGFALLCERECEYMEATDAEAHTRLAFDPRAFFRALRALENIERPPPRRESELFAEQYTLRLEQFGACVEDCFFDAAAAFGALQAMRALEARVQELLTPGAPPSNAPDPIAELLHAVQKRPDEVYALLYRSRSQPSLDSSIASVSESNPPQ